MRFTAFSNDPIAPLDRLFSFTGPLPEFWPLLIENVVAALGVDRGAILQRDRLNAQSWKIMSPSVEEAPPIDLTSEILQLASDTVVKGCATLAATESGESNWRAIRLGQVDPGQDLVLMLEGKTMSPTEEPEPAWLSFLTHAVRLQLARRHGNRQSFESGQIAAALDLVLLLNEQKKWQAGAMLFCNELAARLGASRVSLGWMQGEIVKLQATSHTNKFEKNMSVVLSLENAMQEALDQDEEVLWPVRPDAFIVARDHEIYAREQASGRILSLPIRVDGVGKGVVTVERHEPAFRPGEISGLRLCCDLSARRLDDLETRHRGLATQIKYGARELLAQTLGPEHTWKKAGAIAAAVILAFLVLWPWPYRIDGLFRLNAQTMMSLPAPYEGYIDRVDVQPGDRVTKGQFLLSLDPTQIKLQVAESQAGQMRYRSEAQYAQSSDKVSDMRIAEAQYSEETDRLRQSQYDLARSEVRSPFDGVVVEGDLRERIGSPVKKGEVMMRVCQLDAMQIHVEVPELDISQIKVGQTGEIAFASRPEIHYPIVVDVIEPAAQARKDGNIFVVRCSFHRALPDWWRPGMMGVAKLNAGTASPLWLLTHRLIDFLQLKLWL